MPPFVQALPLLIFPAGVVAAARPAPPRGRHPPRRSDNYVRITSIACAPRGPWRLCP